MTGHAASKLAASSLVAAIGTATALVLYLPPPVVRRPPAARMRNAASSFAVPGWRGVPAPTAGVAPRRTFRAAVSRLSPLPLASKPLVAHVLQARAPLASHAFGGTLQALPALTTIARPAPHRGSLGTRFGETGRAIGSSFRKAGVAIAETIRAGVGG
jgi:hypothetical protein